MFLFSHLKQINMGYIQHLKMSFGYSYKFFYGSIKAIVHGILPNMYETSTSDLIRNMHNEFEKQNKKRN